MHNALLNRIRKFSFFCNFNILLKKPRVALKFLSNYFNILINKKIALRYIDIATDYNCNFSCNHCSTVAMKKPVEDKITIEQYKRLFNQLHALGAIILGITGGEPLVDNRLLDIIKAANPRRFIITVNTNGFLITESILKQLKEAGVDWVLFGLESLDEIENDSFRQAGSFKKVTSAIESVRKCGICVGINVTVSHDNLRSKGFMSLLDWAQKQALPVFLILATQAGRWRGNNAISLIKDDLDFINKTIFDTYTNTFIDYRHNYIKKGCSAGHEKLYVTPYGDIMPCPFIHISFGNIKNKDVSAIREQMLSCKYFKIYWPVCLSAIDSNFLHKHMSKTFNKDELPISLRESGLVNYS